MAGLEAKLERKETMNLLECFCHKFASMLPRAIIYWVMINVGVEVTTGKYENTVVPELTFMDALKRFDEA